LLATARIGIDGDGNIGVELFDERIIEELFYGRVIEFSGKPFEFVVDVVDVSDFVVFICAVELGGTGHVIGGGIIVVDDDVLARDLYGIIVIDDG
jgi:hypothetical protein